LRTLVTRALAAGGQKAADLRRVHAWLVDLAHGLEPDALDAPRRRDGAAVRREVERVLETLPGRFPAGRWSRWVQLVIRQRAARPFAILVLAP
jgi:hypothetical protein